MISLHWLYALAGAMFAAFALLSALDRSNTKRFGNAGFWGLMALSLLGGDAIGDLGNGLLVLGLAGLAGFGFIGRSSPPTTSVEERQGWSERLGNKLFLPALIIPVTALLGTLLYNYTPMGGAGWIEPKRETYVFLGLGVLFAAAGVGDAIGALTRTIIPEGSVFLTVAVFGLGMAIFTMVMGNAFAAFPVMAAAIGVPLLIQGYGGNPAVVGAVGMLAGFCGTLMTPMAANFNLVPAALLELKDQYGVIRAQVATALPLLLFNILIIYVMAFR